MIVAIIPIVLTPEEWWDKFQPMENHITKSGYTYETFGEESAYVYSIDPHFVWTDVDGDSASYIVEGRHYVNRNSYYVTRVPWLEGESYEICVFSDADRDDCMECGRLFEEDGLTNDGEGFCTECREELEMD